MIKEQGIWNDEFYFQFFKPKLSAGFFEHEFSANRSVQFLINNDMPEFDLDERWVNFARMIIDLSESLQKSTA